VEHLFQERKSEDSRHKPARRKTKMEWKIALIAVMIMPLLMIRWWIPRCDTIGVRKANHNALTRAPMTPAAVA
jgi:hypothetical protein